MGGRAPAIKEAESGKEECACADGRHALGSGGHLSQKPQARNADLRWPGPSPAWDEQRPDSILIGCERAVGRQSNARLRSDGSVAHKGPGGDAVQGFPEIAFAVANTSVGPAMSSRQASSNTGTNTAWGIG